MVLQQMEATGQMQWRYNV
jgi:hypothetical protein